MCLHTRAAPFFAAGSWRLQRRCGAAAQLLAASATCRDRSQAAPATPAVATLAVAFGLGLESPSRRLLGSVLLITLGIMGASYGAGSFSGWGAFLMIASVGGEALRLNITQLLMESRRLHPLEALM